MITCINDLVSPVEGATPGPTVAPPATTTTAAPSFTGNQDRCAGKHGISH